MKKKLSLHELEVKSFPTRVRSGLEMIAVDQQYDTVHSGVCTCLFDCDSDPNLNCTQVCPDEIPPVKGKPIAFP